MEQHHGHAKQRSSPGYGHLYPIRRYNLRPLHVCGRHLIRRHRLKRQIRTIAENVAYSQIRSPIGRLGFLAGRKIAEGKIRRVEESEADKLGLFLASQAGYHPDSAIAATEHLRDTYPESSKVQAFLNDDHPRWATRGERIKRNYAEALALYSGRLSKGIDLDSLTSPVVESLSEDRCHDRIGAW
jgi:predicted Zn-dependent protease